MFAVSSFALLSCVVDVAASRTVIVLLLWRRMRKRSSSNAVVAVLQWLVVIWAIYPLRLLWGVRWRCFASCSVAAAIATAYGSM